MELWARSPALETNMTLEKKIARRKLTLLDLADDPGKVSRVRKIVGYSGQQFNET